MENREEWSLHRKWILCMGTLRLAPLMVHMQRCASVHPGHHLEVGAVEAVHTDHAGLGIEVAFVGVGGVQVVLKHCQSIQVLNLRKGRKQADDSTQTGSRRWRVGEHLGGFPSTTLTGILLLRGSSEQLSYAVQRMYGCDHVTPLLLNIPPYSHCPPMTALQISLHRLFYKSEPSFTWANNNNVYRGTGQENT